MNEKLVLIRLQNSNLATVAVFLVRVVALG